MTSQELEALLPEIPLRDAPSLPYAHVATGKVRDIYDLGDRYLIVASDRISAFDVVLPGGIAGKGMILTQLSLWWFEQTRDVVKNHLVPDHARSLAEVLGSRTDLAPRSMLVQKMRPVRLEAVVRGFLAGSGWESYRKTGELWGYSLPSGLSLSSRLPQPLFTPTTKAELGSKDLPVSEAEGRRIVGEARFELIRQLSLRLFERGSVLAQRAGMILADTKFEFGTNGGDELYLIDEVLTPDSSRFWPVATYREGVAQEAFDKQFVRDYLNGLDWDKTDPGPELPESITLKTRQKYLEAFTRLTAQSH